VPTGYPRLTIYRSTPSDRPAAPAADQR
jgi:hypothetical protein